VRFVDHHAESVVVVTPSSALQDLAFLRESIRGGRAVLKLGPEIFNQPFHVGLDIQTQKRVSGRALFIAQFGYRLDKKLCNSRLPHG